MTSELLKKNLSNEMPWDQRRRSCDGPWHKSTGALEINFLESLTYDALPEAFERDSLVRQLMASSIGRLDAGLEDIPIPCKVVAPITLFMNIKSMKWKKVHTIISLGMEL